jgi:hypothetical protein
MAGIKRLIPDFRLNRRLRRHSFSNMSQTIEIDIGA